MFFKIPHYPEDIEYSEKYADDVYEYRHVILPKRVLKDMMRLMPSNQLRLMSEAEWRGIAVQQSRGWMHYEVHRPEPHILLFRRPLNTNPVTGLVEPPEYTHTQLLA
jgi:cyclin-dependent kinase regulatory subunit CKS1